MTKTDYFFLVYSAPNTTQDKTTWRWSYLQHRTLAHSLLRECDLTLTPIAQIRKHVNTFQFTGEISLDGPSNSNVITDDLFINLKGPAVGLLCGSGGGEPQD